MTRILPLASLALGIALGVVAALHLVFWRSGAEPDEPAVTEPAKCGGRTWLPYEDDEGFGYREWRCQQPVGHGGQHSGWLRDSYDGEAVGVG